MCNYCRDDTGYLTKLNKMKKDDTKGASGT